MQNYLNHIQNSASRITIVILEASNNGQNLSSNVGHYLFHVSPRTSYLQLILSSVDTNIEQSHLPLKNKPTGVPIIILQDNSELKS